MDLPFLYFKKTIANLKFLSFSINSHYSPFSNSLSSSGKRLLKTSKFAIHTVVLIKIT